MGRNVTLVVVFLLMGISGAFACSCGHPKGADGMPLKGKEFNEWKIKRAVIVARLKVLSFKISEGKKDGGDIVGIAEAKLVEAIKGKVPRRIELRSWGADQGANCGNAGTLFEAVSTNSLLTAELFPHKTKPRTFWIGFCGLAELGSFGAANE
ncbi:MAG: hypothetical protein IOC35_07630 [Methylobacterium sp.]|jgi:hypothetical protein|nr:hypothetical protein [Methylobacterium sp.]MCA3630175.1 hypothetical protein [Methylobacterium sp.]